MHNCSDWGWILIKVWTHNASHRSPIRECYGMSFVRICKKIYHVTMAPHCLWEPRWVKACSFFFSKKFPNRQTTSFLWVQSLIPLLPLLLSYYTISCSNYHVIFNHFITGLYCIMITSSPAHWSTLDNWAISWYIHGKTKAKQLFNTAVKFKHPGVQLYIFT